MAFVSKIAWAKESRLCHQAMSKCERGKVHLCHVWHLTSRPHPKSYLRSVCHSPFKICFPLYFLSVALLFLRLHLFLLKPLDLLPLLLGPALHPSSPSVFFYNLLFSNSLCTRCIFMFFRLFCLILLSHNQK